MKKENKHLFFQYAIKFTWNADYPGMLFVVVVKILMAILFIVDMIVFSKVIDSLVFSNRVHERFSIVPFVLILVLWIAKVLLQMIDEVLRRRVRMRLSKELSCKVLEKKTKIEYAELENKANWDLFERIGRDPSEQWSLAFFGLMEIMMYIMEMGLLMAAIADRDILLAILVGVLFVPYYMIALKNSKEEYSAYEKSTAHFRRANYYKYILSDREHVSERTLFGFAEWINGVWNQEYSQAVEIEKKANGKVFLRNTVANITAVLFIGAIAVVMLLPLKQGILSGGFFVAVIKATIQFIDALSLNFSQIVIEIEKSKIFFRDFQSFENLEESRSTEGFAIGIKNIETIEFENVSFSYPNEKGKVLDGISFVLSGDRQYAFVGENGTGKTTIIKLLTGFYDHYTGSIRINGIELREIPKTELHRLFSIVYQDYAKYEISLKNNLLSAWSSQIDEDRLEKIFKETGLSDLLAKCPKGLDTNLGKLDGDGIDISTGQWQMVAIARCLLLQANIYILDEPTSAIDPVLEVKIYRIFQECLDGKFAIFITHRLGAARLADEIIVLSKGKVIEQGTHEALLTKKGVYYEMFETQRSWYAEEKQYDLESV